MIIPRLDRLGVWKSLLVLTIALAGCAGKGGSSPPPDDDGAAPMTDAAVDMGIVADAANKDAPPLDGACGSSSGPRKVNGASCSCSTDCASTFCVDGVCCDSACTAGCKSCALTDALGTCTSLGAGAKPRMASACPADVPSSCGLDGMCDGAGGCRKYSASTICRAGTCDGDNSVNAYACDGSGLCKPSPTMICAPYACDGTAGACFPSCTLTSQCAPGQQCVAGSCGKKMKGAPCTGAGDCASGFCADGVCCNVACAGGCVSCNLDQRIGTCWPIDLGAADPRGICKDQGAAGCANNGACDGFGGCAKYAAETRCIAPTCSGTRLNTAGTCDGLGTCRPPGIQNCSPFLCVTGACTSHCTTNADCDVGHACVNGACGPKLNGQPCAAAAECQSNFCVDGLCCDTACTGACRSCNLPSTPGKCTSIPAGTVDPRAVCTDMLAATCGTNGKCDGSGSCQKYAVGTTCAPAKCVSNVFTPPSTCSATGACTAPDSQPCSPYVCNGSACFSTCTTNAQCLTPNSCNSLSCGKKANGASCGSGAECLSTFCAQGICCNNACTGACRSCALGGTPGTCTNVVAGGNDPLGTCVDQGAPSCGTNSKCDGAGACQKYLKGTTCKASTCPAATTQFTGTSTCDGAGLCVTPATGSCFPFLCGAAVCKSTCTADADCASPAVCTGGSCGLKANGRACATGVECVSGFCAQGVCCNTACAGTCQSCALSATLGACTSVTNGATDPKGGCRDQGVATCGTDGFCDGRGACRLYAAGTQCVGPSCPNLASAVTPARTCDGVGVCRPAGAAISCAPFLCNGTTACKAACTVDADCLAPTICDPKTNLCGTKKRLGQACTATIDCLTGNFCVDNVCCSTATCGTCQQCNGTGSPGTCANIASGGADSRCTANPPCGNTGLCNGASACAIAGTGVACGTQSCTGSTFTPISHCTGTGTGACAVPVTSSCTPFICGTNACKTTCVADTDCIAPFTCQGTGTAKSCALKANGLACTLGTQCISGACVDGVCCGSSTCAACQACNVNGMGTCAPVAAGTAAPATLCTDQGAASCGTNGKCDGVGGCQKYANGTVCSAATCPATSATLTLAGACAGGLCAKPTQSCNGFLCNGTTACKTTCTADTTDCASGFFCTGTGGTCSAKKAAGAVCGTGHECTTGNCVDGVCCNSTSCGVCQACNNASSLGTCSNVAAGTADASCAVGAVCGQTGLCNAAGACAVAAATVSCGTASCNGSVFTAVSHCTGTAPGACAAPSTTICSTTGQICTTSGCAHCTADAQCGAGNFCQNPGASTGTCTVAGCTLDSQCAAGSFCQNPGVATGNCVVKFAPGAACGTVGNQCASNNCVNGVCCTTPSCGSCQACNINGLGTCASTPPGSTPVPASACTDQGAPSCGTTGLCEAGVCQKYPDGTKCSDQTCPMSTSPSVTLAGSCLLGACAKGTQLCLGFVCSTTTDMCLTVCGGDGDCVAPSNFCDGGTCVAKRGPAAACSAASQCASNSCVDGVCCTAGVTSCGTCRSCAVTGLEGACHDVLGGNPDPSGACMTQSINDGCVQPTCDGAGACEATQCMNNFACASPKGCNTQCLNDGDCAAGNTCDVGAMTCGP